MCLEQIILTEKNQIRAWKVFGEVDGKLYPIFRSALERNGKIFGIYNELYCQKDPENYSYFREFDRNKFHEGFFHAFLTPNDAFNLKQEILEGNWNTWGVKPVVYLVEGKIHYIGKLCHHRKPMKIACVLNNMQILKEVTCA